MSNCLSYWFPYLEVARLPVPQTVIVKTDVDFTPLLDGKSCDGFGDFIGELDQAIHRIGLPCFIRTGETAHKHDWNRSCYLDTGYRLGAHVFNLIEFSACADFLGLPTNVWAVRELLPTTPLLTAFHGEMPICREFRVFVAGGEVVCHHPYWPEDSLTRGLADWPDDWNQVYDRLCRLTPGEALEIRRLARSAGEAVPGDWSVDILETERGWYIIDMALAGQSFHWSGCEQAGRFPDPRQLA